MSATARVPDGTGFSSAGGKLEPATFRTGGANVAISSFEYANGELTLTINPYKPLEGHWLYLIGMDREDIVQLATADATADETDGTFTSSLDSAPRADGDTLMLQIGRQRLRSSPP